MATPKVTKGRIVRLTIDSTDPENESFPAIVTKVNENGSISATVFTPYGTQLEDDVPFSETPADGHWNWPAREE